MSPKELKELDEDEVWLLMQVQELLLNAKVPTEDRYWIDKNGEIQTNAT